MNVDFQKQTVDPVQVSFNTLDKSRTITDLLLTIEVTEVRAVWPRRQSSPSSLSGAASLSTRDSGGGHAPARSLCA